MSNTRAGQPSERTPDFIPGWYEARPGNPDPVTREAVRIFDDGTFPIAFLRSTEMVHLPQRPQLGVCIGNARHSEMELAVPPGYWIVRDGDGELHNWRDEDFKEKYVRGLLEWRPPVERDAPSGRPAAAERNRHGAESVEATIVASSDSSQVGRTGRVPLEALGSPTTGLSAAGEKCDVKVVVSGAPFKIETSTTATVEEVVEQAILKAGAKTHPSIDWHLRTEDGRRLDRIVGDAGLVDGETTLFLDPEVGGGCEERSAMPAFEAAMRHLHEELEADRPQSEAAFARQLYTDDGTRLQKVGQVGVDSGRVMLVDPCYAERVKSGNVVSSLGISDVRHVESAVNLGIVAQTGVGDGLFPVIAEIVDGKLNGLLIDFGNDHLEDGILGARELARRGLRDNPHLPEGYAEKLTAELAEGAGWRRTQPAEGTRRHLILAAIEEQDVLSPSEALEFADAVESALLMATIHAEAMERGAETLTTGIREVVLDGVAPDRDPLHAVVEGLQAEALSAAGILDLMMIPREERGETLTVPGRLTLLMQRHAEALARRHAPAADVPAGTREIHVVLKQVDDGERSPTYEFWEVEDQWGRGICFPMVEQEGTQNLFHVVIPYGRDDAWVAEVAYQAAGAATRAALGGRPASHVMATVCEAVGELLAEFGLPCWGADEQAQGETEGGGGPGREHSADDPTLSLPPEGSQTRMIFDALRAEDVTLSNVAALSYAHAVAEGLGEGDVKADVEEDTRFASDEGID